MDQLVVRLRSVSSELKRVSNRLNDERRRRMEFIDKQLANKPPVALPADPRKVRLEMIRRHLEEKKVKDQEFAEWEAECNKLAEEAKLEANRERLREWQQVRQQNKNETVNL